MFGWCSKLLATKKGGQARFGGKHKPLAKHIVYSFTSALAGSCGQTLPAKPHTLPSLGPPRVPRIVKRIGSSNGCSAFRIFRRVSHNATPRSASSARGADTDVRTTHLTVGWGSSGSFRGSVAQRKRKSKRRVFVSSTCPSFQRCA